MRRSRTDGHGLTRRMPGIARIGCGMKRKSTDSSPPCIRTFAAGVTPMAQALPVPASAYAVQESDVEARLRPVAGCH